MEPESNQQHQGTTFFSPPTLLIGLFFFLPVAIPSLFGWLNGLLAVPVFFLFITTGDEKQATLLIRNGLLFAAVGALLLNKFELIVFALTMLPLGYSLYRSTQRGDDPVTAGIQGVITLAASWFLFWLVYGGMSGINPYANLLATLDGSFDQIIKIYRDQSDLPVDVQYNLEQLVIGIRYFLPRILPGLLAGSVILTVWLNMVIGNRLLLRVQPEKAAWPEFSRWQLPDKLVWLVIVATVLSTIGGGVVKSTGYCLAIVSVMLFFFQGMAILIHFLNRWKVPGFLRIILYVILAVQSYAIVVLAMVGIADIWLDFRKLAQDTQETENK